MRQTRHVQRSLYLFAPLPVFQPSGYENYVRLIASSFNLLLLQ
jgi:hypothetical protein